MIKKIIVIGDIHGRNIWEDIVNTTTADKYIFIGDYFDSYNIISRNKIIDNFKKIIELKDSRPDDVVLLIGNHDYHYMPFVYDTYSGFDRVLKTMIGTDLLIENLHKFKMCHRECDFLFSHAGISNAWLILNGWNGEPIDEFVNDMWKYKPDVFKHNGIDPYGDNINSSPIWIRPKSLMASNHNSKEWIQVVGHTSFDNLTIIDNYYFIDCLANNEYLTIEINDGTSNAIISKI